MEIERGHQRPTIKKHHHDPQKNSHLNELLLRAWTSLTHGRRPGLNFFRGLQVRAAIRGSGGASPMPENPDGDHHQDCKL